MSIFSFIGLDIIDIKKALRQGAVIIDVRTAAAYEEERIPGSANIPIDEIAGNIERLIMIDKPILFCSNSGAINTMAIQMMKNHQFYKVYNGGHWRRLLAIKNNLSIHY